MARSILLWVGAALALVVVLAFLGITLVLGSYGVGWGQVFKTVGAQQADATPIRNAEGPITTPNGIAERGFVKIGGIDQWVTIRSEDKRNPIILLLHGGPGDTFSQLAYFFRHWEKDFTLVQWDQRGAGRTYGRYGKDTPDMTLDRMIEDGAEVADYARRRLNQSKVILVGHSWGSALGVYLLKRHPDLFSAYVGTGMLVSDREILEGEFTALLDQLTKEHKTSALARLKKLGPPPYASDADEEVLRRELMRYLASADKGYLLGSVALMMRSPWYSYKDFQNLQAGHLSFSLVKMYPVLKTIDLRTLGYDMPIPFFIVDGRDDRIAPPATAAEYFAHISAPDKEMILIDGGGHFAMISHSEAFLRFLTERVRPAALKGTEALQSAAP